jgi:hypothetical protein
MHGFFVGVDHGGYRWEGTGSQERRVRAMEDQPLLLRCFDCTGSLSHAPHLIRL